MMNNITSILKQYLIFLTLIIFKILYIHGDDIDFSSKPFKFFLNLDYFVYSSHKTSTQSFVTSLKSNFYKTSHVHCLENIRINNQQFIESLKAYNDKHGHKMKIITVIRNPFDRSISSFFQRYFTDEIKFNNISPSETIIEKLNTTELYSHFDNYISNRNDTLSGMIESLYELQKSLNINIIQYIRENSKPIARRSLDEKYKSYFYENDLLQLYIFDYRIAIRDLRGYINHVLKLNIKTITNSNVSKKKPYYKKYVALKTYINDHKDISSQVLNKILSGYTDRDVPFFFNFQL